ncbi:hypothetical protein PUNSTDRAFT_121126 [Punctularia strigosozonata HHB-11173 SS5]|uniref:uncharacterized protein n=1 Tax=Punctularia strigosozonata (strain HHB-11173) TaxID=741275 RepID=UPI0004418173|nr:uncharacterized protein PUNSTDRAFT_121126 [Punctularia strigosozonata HHB-11173 SS5]EIN07959.1 hypothetical protein PUNSTDRAFT_121126 [Punctularia strigosozonata HHB-11173 SS5]
MSTPVTPFIPPQPGFSPASVSNQLSPPPLVDRPPQPGERPGWPTIDMTNMGNFPMGYPTPQGLVVPMMPGVFPGAQHFTPAAPAGGIPQSYFIPPVALPPAGAPGSTHQVDPHTGLSNDWIGFEQAQRLAGRTPAAPHAALHGGGAPSGWPTPAASTAFVTPMMGTMPMAGMGGWPQVAPAGWPGATAQAQAQAQAAAMAAATPGWGMGGMLLASPGVPNQPMAPPMTRSRKSSFGPHKESGDRVPRFTPGPNYGPVLEPFVAKVVRAHLELNPLLQAPADNHSPDKDPPYLKWCMLFPESFCQRSSDPPHRSWMVGRDEPATFPRVTHLRIISPSFPWTVDVRAEDRGIGVTCGDVIQQLDKFLHELVRKEEYAHAGKQRSKMMNEAYHFNRSTAHGVPGGRLGAGMRRLDWLCRETMWGGLEENDRYVREHAAGLSCTFVLTCKKMYALTEEEIRNQEQLEAEARSRPRSVLSRHSRSRSRGPD